MENKKTGERTNLYMTIYFSANLLLFIFCYLGLGQVKILSGPSAAARMGQGAERCCHGLGYLRQFLGRALRLRQAMWPSAAARTGQGARRCGHVVNYILVLHIRFMYKIDRRVQKSQIRKLPIFGPLFPCLCVQYSLYGHLNLENKC